MLAEAISAYRWNQSSVRVCKAPRMKYSTCLQVLRDARNLGLGDFHDDAVADAFLAEVDAASAATHSGARP